MGYSSPGLKLHQKRGKTCFSAARHLSFAPALAKVNRACNFSTVHASNCRVANTMLIYLLAFVGGVLTILSPCILPVLPFVFARADQPFRRSGLPLLVGMALMFSVVATAAVFAGHWVVRLNQAGRYAAMAVFLVLGLTLLFPSLAEVLTRPLVRAGSRYQGRPSTKITVGKSFVLGISTGLLWAPCAGPIGRSSILRNCALCGEQSNFRPEAVSIF